MLGSPPRHEWERTGRRCAAWDDIDGGGIPEVAYKGAFAMVAANRGGGNWGASSQGDPTMAWRAEAVDEFPTSQHVTWADLDGDGNRERINALLFGV